MAVDVRDAMLEPLSVETSGLVWMAVMGVLCLGLRHPQYVGPSRQMVAEFTDELGRRLVGAGVLTPVELAAVNRQEQTESPHGGLR